MAITHALVVDDSRSARVALKKLLEEHDLEVSMADSGESALEFLKKHKVDVVFMDHTMPGMDGLEAVGAIKANPDTATIPVMMYTTREGEVYVGQARALGAVGVLPKNVQPHQLFEMLLKLGLVHDRRAGNRDEEEAPAADLARIANDVDRQLEDQALGMSVQTLVTRILEDQHLTLRSDILRSQRSFAKEVAKEIVREQERNNTDADDDVPRQITLRRVVIGVSLILVVVSGFLALQFKAQRDGALNRLAMSAALPMEPIADEVGPLQEQLTATRDRLSGVAGDAISSLGWAVNDGNEAGMNDNAFSDALREKTEELVARLERFGFKGAVQLTSHLGQFCLMINDTGGYYLAPPEVPASQCDYTGHVLENSTYASDRLSVPFARFYQSREDSPVRVTLVALDASESEPIEAYPSGDVSAGEWNAVARRNNRVVFDLIPDQS